jgi:hypothetical protein
MLSRMGWLYSTKVQWCTLINEKEKSNGASVVRVGKRRVDVTCFALGRNHDDVGVILLVWVEDRTLIKKKIKLSGSDPPQQSVCLVWCCCCCVCVRADGRPNPTSCRPTIHGPWCTSSWRSSCRKPETTFFRQHYHFEFLPKQLFATPSSSSFSFFFREHQTLCIASDFGSWTYVWSHRPKKMDQAKTYVSSLVYRRTEVTSACSSLWILLLSLHFSFLRVRWDLQYVDVMITSLLQFRFEMETGMEQIGSRLQALKRLYGLAASASQGSGTAHEKCNIRIVNFTASLLF